MTEIHDLVPHRGTMSWLSRVIEVGPEHLVAEADIGPDHLLLRDGRLSAATGVEFMAQTVAAWAGVQRRAQGGQPLIGFLLGTRRYQCSRSHFALGSTLRIEVRRSFQAENGLSQFEARIAIEGEAVASANLNVFGPDDPEAFLAGHAL
ncbi:putative hotdog family 3-hydroxylacyl-ACP dehydratase [Inhella inkyongensis]|uniref:Putative hotdog family 3-hydroxylacyl-ACP dehydratase n=1 Tax=Inhella inkyongensis TaxID=392593 RepID=A0A840SBP8_9BURK|nr:hypothetical protein [Inhella inkyongensis]MBB5205770.1 putative hotdog family 3-hydroxylacyl-ACP dehydratase [Inhella inkyongensis]